MHTFLNALNYDRWWSNLISYLNTGTNTLKLYPYKWLHVILCNCTDLRQEKWKVCWAMCQAREMIRKGVKIRIKVGKQKICSREQRKDRTPNTRRGSNEQNWEHITSPTLNYSTKWRMLTETSRNHRKKKGVRRNRSIKQKLGHSPG